MLQILSQYRIAVLQFGKGTGRHWLLVTLMPMKKKKSLQGIPCGPGVRTPNSHCRGPGFDCWSKLKFHKLRGAAKKEKRKSLHVGVMSVRPKRVFLSSCHSTELTSSLITNSEICKCFKNRNRLK